jgi:ligand-binding sensor domain-containing protein
MADIAAATDTVGATAAGIAVATAAATTVEATAVRVDSVAVLLVAADTGKSWVGTMEGLASDRQPFLLVSDLRQPWLM